MRPNRIPWPIIKPQVEENIEKRDTVATMPATLMVAPKGQPHQPRPSPLGSGRMSIPEPGKGETPPCPCLALSGLSVGLKWRSQALPLADLFSPFGAGSSDPASLL
jgi:hypothetical protein